MVQAPVLTDEDFHEISVLIKKRFGISLGPQKRSLVKARLQKYVHTLGFDSFSAYLRYLRNDHSGKEWAALADRLSTNHTFFNRENIHFDFLRQTVLPFWKNRLGPGQKLRLWSAGCSSGEEAYQMAMVLTDYFTSVLVKNKAAILATDISHQALQKARQGRYSADQVRPLGQTYVRKYFLPQNASTFEVKPFLKELILFRRLNLVRPVFPFKHKFHVIFCRNVMIYFDESTRRELVERFHHYLMPGGFLFIGHSENIDFNNPYFKFVRPSIFVHEGGT